MAVLIDVDRGGGWSGRRRAFVAVLGALAVAVWMPSAALSQSVGFSGPTGFPAGADLGGDIYRIGVADFNADGDLDLAVPTFGPEPNISILLGGAGGSFGAPISVAMPAGFRTTSLAVGDFNADRDPDLVVVSLSATFDVPRNVAVVLGGAGATFSAPTAFAAGEFPIDVAVGDFNGDGDPDLAVANLNGFTTSAISLYVGGPGGSFTSVAGIGPFPGGLIPATPQSLSVADFNGDGDADIAAVLPRDNAVAVLPGGPGASFGAPTTTQPLLAEGFLTPTSAVGDFNRDGDPDLAVVNRLGELIVLVGSTGGSFGAPIRLTAGGALQSVAVADFNADGDPDLAVTDIVGGRVAVFVGGAGASFSGPTVFALGDSPRAITTGDFDADRDADIAAANTGSNDVSVLLNTTRVRPTSKDQCKNGGWRNFPGFKNQGDCVSFVATGGRNPPGAG
jgi:hypothetical protein